MKVAYLINCPLKSNKNLPISVSLTSKPCDKAENKAEMAEIARKGCRELWLNPGSESEALLQEASRLGLDPIVACSIVDVGINPQQL